MLRLILGVIIETIFGYFMKKKESENELAEIDETEPLVHPDTAKRFLGGERV